jgi:hypothetical protein
MMESCYSPKHARYEAIGGKGISVAGEWHDYSVFLDEMGEMPEGHALTRIDPGLDYSGRNCRWVKRGQVAKASSIMLEMDGFRMNLTEWARHLQVPRTRLYWRYQNGYTDREVLLGRQKAS